MSQVISAVTFLMDLYSASSEEREIEACFFDFHEMGEPPSVMKNTLINRRESLQDAQSESQKAFRDREREDDKRIYCPRS